MRIGEIGYWHGILKQVTNLGDKNMAVPVV